MKIDSSLFDKVVEAAPSAMIMIDSLGRILLVNLQAEKLFQYSRQELLGMPIEKLVPEKFHAHHPGLRDKFFLEPKVRAMGAGRELFGLRKDGSEVPIEIGLNPLTIENQVFVLASIIDITERKKNEQLLASQEAALEASRIKSQFLATMSHEIRTPLNGIIGLTNLLFELDMTEAQREHLQGIRISADLLLDLINDILDLSKVEADKMDLEVVHFDLRQTVADAISVSRTAAKLKQIEISTEIDFRLPSWFKGDSAKLKQVLINLVGNAIKFTFQGKVTVRVLQSQKENSEPSSVYFEVEDTGIGITDEIRGRLFQVFTQGDSSTRRKFGGTGLGLSISKKLIQIMGGDIGVETKIGQGSRFWFHIPLLEGEEIQTKLSPRTRPIQPPVHFKDLRILVAEDNAINQKVALGSLKNLGLQGQAVGNGAEALELVQNFSFDLVLMDCHMPEMDGYEATQKIRSLASEKLNKMPIIAMTANVMQGDRERCLAMGMNDYISKPIDNDELERVLLKWLPQKSGENRSDLISLALDNVQKNYGPAMLQEVIQTFLQATPRSLSQIAKAYDSQNFSALLTEAHSLKSGSLILGLRLFSDLAFEIERSCQQKIFDGLPDMIASLSKEFEVIREELEKIRNTSRAPLPS